MKNKNSIEKWRKKLREREKNNILYVGKLFIECEKELEIHSKMMRIRREKNKGI